MTTYDLCKQLASRGKLTADKLDVFLLANRITEGQYNELMALIK